MAQKTGTKPKGPKKGPNKQPNKPSAGKTAPRKTVKRPQKTAPAVRRASANDIAWYASDIGLLQATANHPYSENLGDSFDLTTADCSINIADSIDTVPGVCVLKIAPSIGIAKDAKSAANIAMRAIETYVRKMNSGAKNYEATDLMIYLLAMDQIYSFYGWLTRLYAMARSYDMYNKYAPAAMLQAIGVDSQDIRLHLNDLYGYLLLTANQVNRFAVPKGLKYFERHYWIFSNAYKDFNSAKAQVYIFDPEFFWKFEGYADTSGGKLTASPLVPSSGDLLKFQDIVTYFDSMLNAVLGEDDMGIMAGDIMKAYGRENLYFILPPDVNSVIMPSYQPEVLTQIQNLTAVGPIVNDDMTTAVLRTWDVTQSHAGFEDSILQHRPAVIVPTGRPTLGALNKMLSVPVGVDQTSPELTMVATRLTTFISGKAFNNSTWNSNKHSAKLSTCGSDVCTTIELFYYDRNGVLRSTGKYSSFVEVGAGLMGDETTLDEGAAKFLALLSQFDYHPTIVQYAYSDPSEMGSVDVTFNDCAALYGLFGHIDTYTILTDYEQTRMNNTAIWSLFAVPAMALWK